MGKDLGSESLKGDLDDCDLLCTCNALAMHLRIIIKNLRMFPVTPGIDYEIRELKSRQQALLHICFCRRNP
jgi:hypothetical protein